MSLTDKQRRTIVDLELEKAHDAYKATEILVDAKLWSNAANRLYYALFHAVCALLIHDGYEVGTHKGARILLGQHYVKTGKLPQKYSQLYSQIETIRENGDYNHYYNVTPEEMIDRLVPAKEMIDTIAAMVKE